MTSRLPDYLQPFLKEAQQYISKGLVRDVEFSGGTYQVLVIDAKTEEGVWAFLQLNSKGQIKDCFCSCEQGEEDGHCVHLAAAFLRIYNGQSVPLHQRFEHSLFYALCKLYADRIGDDPIALQHDKQNRYSHTSAGGKVVFSIKATTPEASERLYSIIEERSQETEETSIKFSNLPQDELDLWREGKPTDHLRYELSFWNDIAHWFMQLQDAHEPCTITFGYTSSQIPNHITLSFPSVEALFYISEANLPLIIPALETVNSPLKVHYTSQDAIESITYSKTTDTLHIEHKKGSKDKQKEDGAHEHIFGGWRYVPEHGFYEHGAHQLLNRSTLSGADLVQALNAHAKTIQALLKGTALHSNTIRLSYKLTFDPKGDLHISAYAFSPGDLTKPNAHYYVNWIYIEDDGFYPIEEPRFNTAEIIVRATEISEFVRKERSWLNTQEGFQVFLTSIESQITYSLSRDNRLSFVRTHTSTERSGAGKDFGAWIYMPGEGFYSKISSYTSLPVNSGTSIPAEQIPFFIHVHKSELEGIPGFFNPKSPVMKMGLKIELVGNSIHVNREYELRPECVAKDVRFFDNVVYVGGEGFYELPPEYAIPERYRHPVVIEPKDISTFLNLDFEALQEVASSVDIRLIKPESIQLSASNVSEETGPQKGWYSLQAGYETDRGFIPVSEIATALRQKKEYLFHKAGLIDLTDPMFDWLRQMPKNRFEKDTNNVLLPILELIRLDALQKVTIKGTGSEASRSRAILKEINEFHVAVKPDLTHLKSILRPYQDLGVQWLWFLFCHELSGLLCDDMGLGKTHQAMGLMAAVLNYFKKHEPDARPQFLVVCPTSVLYHWQEKLLEYMPNLRVCLFYGSGRNIEEFNNHQYDLLLTSYGIWRMEFEHLSDIHFEVAILDELQIAKNHHSRVHLSLRHLKARLRIGLTGTPIENQLRELKALFDLVLPGYMPGEIDYRELFMKPIERDNDHKKKRLLQRFVKPFILRRKKQEVLEDLPEKVEEVIHCVLSPEQQRMYNEIVQQSRQHILEQIRDKSMPIPYMHIFAVLSSLKQICNHPAAFLKKPEEYKKYESGKWDLFVELLNEARDSQQKVVVFTQYLAMLDIFESYMTENNIGFATIRGSTTNRGEQVRRFNQDPTCEVFLGSLQASGLGVDLTAGSVVIHYDRWWNAAREDQATDRVHRIGQTRGVEVFKIVTKGTFEERIDAIIKKKSRLLEEVVGADDHRFLKKFDRDEIFLLLQEVEEAK